MAACSLDRKSTRLNSSHTEIYTLSLHDALPIFAHVANFARHSLTIRTLAHTMTPRRGSQDGDGCLQLRSEEHTSELQSHRDLHSFPTRRSSDLRSCGELRQAFVDNPHTSAHNDPAAWLSRRRWLLAA